jgi:phage FluMu protein Com
MIDVRCKYCGRLQMRLDFGIGEIKCGRCGKIVKFRVTSQSLDRFIEKLKTRDKDIKLDKLDKK